ncbi:DUF4959 domain-containing protein [Prolixibacteraceae bacterium JC049]|nr:DUF4959 domain-containing protein [Prolixibacteraceae bacterium JC049]
MVIFKFQNMKRYILQSIFIAFILTFVACDDDSEKNNGIAPQMVDNISVIGMPGAVKIQYSIPDQNDFLYVQAEYINQQNKTVFVKSSLYNNFLEINGFLEEREYDITLTTFNRAGQQSEPHHIKATPLKSPIIKVFESLEMTKDFGGPRVTYTNQDKAQVGIIIISKDEYGNYKDSFAQFVQQEEGFVIARGHKAEETVFGAYVSDKYGNLSDTLFATLTPYYEVEADYSTFRAANLPTDDPSAHGWHVHHLWDGKVGEPGYHTGSTTVNEGYAQLTIDIGKEKAITLSRFKLWQRNNIARYGNGNPRKWQVYGSNNPDDKDSWVHFGDFEMFKPSGLPLGQTTQEDKDAASAGHEYLMPSGIPAVRFIQLRITETWLGPPTGVHFCELRFWGEYATN